MHFLAKAVYLVVCLAPAIEPLLAATCTITKYNEDTINSAVEECTDITLDGIEVPSGVTLTLNLRQGTKLTFQGWITWGYYEWNGPLMNITGTDLEITGALGHVLDGRGNLWWDTFGEHGGTIKPLLFILHGTNNTVIHDLNVKNPPYHAIWIEHSDGVIVHDINIDSLDGDTLGGHNTDGFNVWSSNNVSFERIIVYNQDDCIAVKSGTNVEIRDTFCHGSHGLSIGSVGGRDYNIVENVLISNSAVVNADNGIRVKTVYGATGSVTNITYENIALRDINNYGIIIDGDYNIETGEPTGVATDGVPIKGLTLRNITGTVKKEGVNIYVLVKGASDWHWDDIDVTGGEAIKECDGIPEGTGISC